MNRKSFSAFLSVAVLLAIGGQVSARRVTHPVTPKNINEQPFSFTVNVKDVGNVKEFEVLVKSKGRGHPAPVPSAYGKVVIQRCGKKPAAFPPVGRVEAKGMQKYTF